MQTIETLYKNINLATVLNEDQKISGPPGMKYLRIDVGLAGDACNSALWLSNTVDRYVIGIEPLPYHWEHLYEIGSPDGVAATLRHPTWDILQLKNNVVTKNRTIVCNIGKRFCGLRCAIDNVKAPTIKDFYFMDPSTNGSGSSSLLEATTHHPHKPKEIIPVNTISLKFLLDHIDWDIFPFVEHLKTDCEGNDYNVIYSLGDYLEKIVFITCEVADGICHNNEPDLSEFLLFMFNKGFRSFGSGDPGTTFAVEGRELKLINLKFIKDVKKYNLSCETLGL